jgi:hypothetical protein
MAAGLQKAKGVRHAKDTEEVQEAKGFMGF